ncbi:hypothetical protein HOLleu_40831 [Holothuria leucospilota]|uniref:Uncharacterized protein n=1 Tax=Holothuria leucospilota TaxID=206669 RepID=A0A9Q0YDX0_HOLLE|nr:hypothetical protein HOLleu_40831 [Holothuria leucospilota]
MTQNVRIIVIFVSSLYLKTISLEAEKLCLIHTALTIVGFVRPSYMSSSHRNVHIHRVTALDSVVLICGEKVGKGRWKNGETYVVVNQEFTRVTPIQLR